MAFGRLRDRGVRWRRDICSEVALLMDQPSATGRWKAPFVFKLAVSPTGEGVIAFVAHQLVLERSEPGVVAAFNALWRHSRRDHRLSE